jgi:hypothetical protein
MKCHVKCLLTLPALAAAALALLCTGALAAERAFYFPLDTDPGWSRTGEWAFGQPSGQGGASHGFPDPTSGFTGSNVFGINLNGDYSLAVGTNYLTTAPMDLSRYTNVTLQFKRWLNTDWPPYVTQSIEVSSNGINWSTVWTNVAGVTLADSAWTNVSYNISALADARTNVMIRWGHRVGQTGAYAFSGWNIDDVEILGTQVRSLLLTMPANATEGDGVLAGAGHLSILPAPLATVVVTLTSSDITAVTVPSTIVVAPGQTNVDLDITIIDDTLLDGTQTATVTATATGFVSAHASIAVYDNETSTLQVVLPPTVIGSPGTIQGRLLSSGVPAASFTASLTSSDTNEIQVPPTVVIPPGQTSIVFNVTVLDDGRINGPQTVTVTAHVSGWTDGSTNIVVLDNENVNLAVSLPGVATEGAGLLSNAGHVSISGTLPTNLVVTLSSSNATEVAPSPPTATIPAGQLTANFNLFVGHDPAVTGPLNVAINADAPGFITGSSTMLILDYESPPPPTNPVPANLATNIPANTSLSWSGGSGDVTNDVYLGTNPAPGPAEFLGSTTGLSWTHPLLDPNTTYYWKVVSRRGGFAGSAIWRFTTRGVDHFAWGNISSPQWVGQPFGVSVTAQDELGRTVQNFPGPVTLSGWTGVNFGTNTLLGSPPASLTDIGNYTLAFAFTPNTNITVTHVRSFSGTKVSLWTTGGVLVATQNVGGPPGVWTDTPLANTVSLSAGTTYRLGFYTGGNTTYYYNTNRPSTFANGTITNGYYYSLGDGFPAIFVHGNPYVFLCDLRYTTGNAAPVPITPTVSGPFVNGTWTGNVTVQHVANAMRLQADDALGHSGSSSNFTVGLQNDLSLTMTATPNPVTIGALWTNMLVLTNTGPTTASGVFITNQFPNTAGFSFATASQGTFTVAGNQVVFDVGTVTGGGIATFQLVVAPAAAGLISNSAVVVRAEADADPSNNAAVTTTLAVMPALSINSVAVYEGNSGWTPILFTVQLQPPTPKEVWVSFTTVDGTATAGSDYMARSGLVKFAPYQTNETIVTYVFGDTNIEPGETFTIVLSEPVNAALGTAVGIGTIINDDFPPGPMVAYLRSTAGLPWASPVNEAILTEVFGTNWEDLRYETVTNIGALFSTAKRFIFMEGGDIDANEMGLFLSNNLVIISNWVSAGGSLLVNTAPNEGGNINFGFGALLTYPDSCSTAQAVFPAHPIFNGPYVPVGTNFTGSAFGHATVSGPGLTPLITDAFTGHFELAERTYGAGHLMFGGMTLPIFHLPQPQGSNLLANILVYGAGAGGAATNLPPGIFGQPASLTAYVGNNVTFSVAAFGSPPLSYSWRRAGAVIAGATDVSYTLNNVQLSDSGAVFSCLVSNLFGAALSSGAVLTVLTGPPQPVFLTGNFLYLPIDTNGVFIANSTGGKYNPAGTGGASGVDFWFPGTPVYNYAIGVAGLNYFNGAFQTLTLSNATSGGTQRAIIDAIVTTGLHFRRDISFGTSSKAIRIVDTLQNTGASALANVVRLDSTDPDQDSITNGTYNTLNDVVSIGMPNDMVVATGPLTGLSLGLGSESGVQIPSATGFNNTNAYDFLTVVDPNGASADIAINLAQNYGPLDAGTTRTSVWYMVFGNSKFEVTNAFALIIATNLPPPPAPSFSRMWLGPNGVAHIEISGSPGKVYNVFGSTNLVDWQLLSVVTNLNGIVPFVDPAATNYTQRFYRCAER